MSQTTYIDVKFNNDIDIIQIILSLRKSGWTENDNGKILFLPLGDDDYNWLRKPQDQFATVLEEIKKKQMQGETIGISMTWEDSNIGGQFVYLPENNMLSFSVTINRIKLSNDPYNRFTAIDWYYTKIITALAMCGCDIFSVEIKEY